MSESPKTEVDLLVEIRDLLRSREEKYDLYLKQANDRHAHQLKEQKDSAVNSWIWLCFGMTLAVFIGGLMLRAIVR